MRKVRAVDAALRSKGMTRSEGHHVMYRKDLDGVTSVITRISHGQKEIGDTLGRLMARQCSLRLQEFWQLVDCTLSESDWDKLLRQRTDGRPNGFTE